MVAAWKGPSIRQQEGEGSEGSSLEAGGCYPSVHGTARQAGAPGLGWARQLARGPASSLSSAAQLVRSLYWSRILIGDPEARAEPLALGLVISLSFVMEPLSFGNRLSSSLAQLPMVFGRKQRC